jgi:phosphoglucosamine mutase
MSNFGLFRSLEKIGIECAVTAVGDKYVYECMSKNGYSVGGEQSGHIILSQFATTGDGILTCLKLAEVMLKRQMKMSELLAEFDEYPQALRTLYVTDRDSSIGDPEVQALVKETEQVLGENGRILLRASGTESVLRLIIEGDREDVCVDYATRFEKLLRKKGYLIKVK